MNAPLYTFTPTVGTRVETGYEIDFGLNVGVCSNREDANMQRVTGRT